jgi:hypothetical protein
MKMTLHTSVLYGLALCIGISQTAKSIAETALPIPDHIVILILENHGYTQIINAASAPKINALAYDSSSALFTLSFGVEHPSQPNYLDLYSGCNQNVTNDNVPPTFFTTENLGYQLINSGRSFATYSEDLPSVGFNGASSGNYARKHNPAANWVGSGTNQIPATTNQPFTAFPTDFTTLPTVSYVIPNQLNDMHSGGISTADKWMDSNLNGYIQWAKTHNSLFILTFDEDDAVEFNHITTIFSGQMVKHGNYSESINHYNVLRTIENMYGLTYACHAATTSTISDCWNTITGIKQSKQDEYSFSVFPNPSRGEFTILVKGAAGQLQKFEIYNMCGDLVDAGTEEITGSAASKEIHLKNFSPGIYFVKGTIGDYTTAYKKVVIE